MAKHTNSHTRRICRKTNRQILVDRISAELLLEHIQLNARRTIHDEKRSYYCRFCGGYHLTSQDKRAEIRDLPYSA